MFWLEVVTQRLVLWPQATETASNEFKRRLTLQNYSLAVL